MTLAALCDAGVSFSDIQTSIDSLNLPGVRIHLSEVMKHGFRAKSIRVEHPEQHAHRGYSDIAAIIQQASALTPRQKSLALDLFLAVAQAEARVHGSDLDHVHFHEVGAIDSIVDIVGTAIGFDLLGVERIVCGPIPTGRGFVHIDHGVCPVPTPGTAELLKGIPLRDVPLLAELTTPTGAAIARVLADGFGPLPDMMIEQIGCGAGTLTFPDRANILRLFVGTIEPAIHQEQITLLETNLDQISGEIIGYTTRKLLDAGALDVYSIPIQMKKNRPGVILSVLTRPELVSRHEAILFQETGTLGIRRQQLFRSVRARASTNVMTPFGTVAGKVSLRPDGTSEFAPEFEECARLASAAEVPLRDVYRAAVIAHSATEPPLGMPATMVRQEPRDHSHSHDHDHGHSHDHDHHR